MPDRLWWAAPSASSEWARRSGDKGARSRMRLGAFIEPADFVIRALASPPLRWLRRPGGKAGTLTCSTWQGVRTCTDASGYVSHESVLERHHHRQRQLWRPLVNEHLAGPCETTTVMPGRSGTPWFRSPQPAFIGDRRMFEILSGLSEDRTEASVQLPSMAGPQKMSADELSELVRHLTPTGAHVPAHEPDPPPKIETVGAPTRT